MAYWMIWNRYKRPSGQPCMLVMMTSFYGNARNKKFWAMPGGDIPYTGFLDRKNLKVNPGVNYNTTSRPVASPDLVRQRGKHATIGVPRA